MIRIITLALLLATPAVAQTDSQKAQLCLNEGNLARGLMELRFKGGTLEQALKALERQRDRRGEEDMALVTEIALGAYRGPHWRNPVEQAAAIEKYQTQVIVDCYDR